MKVVGKAKQGYDMIKPLMKPFGGLESTRVGGGLEALDMDKGMVDEEIERRRRSDGRELKVCRWSDRDVSEMQETERSDDRPPWREVMTDTVGLRRVRKVFEGEPKRQGVKQVDSGVRKRRRDDWGIDSCREMRRRDMYPRAEGRSEPQSMPSQDEEVQRAVESKGEQRGMLTPNSHGVEPRQEHRGGREPWGAAKNDGEGVEMPCSLRQSLREVERKSCKVKEECYGGREPWGVVENDEEGMEMPCSLRQSLGEVERIGCKVKEERHGGREPWGAAKNDGEGMEMTRSLRKTHGEVERKGCKVNEERHGEGMEMLRSLRKTHGEVERKGCKVKEERHSGREPWGAAKNDGEGMEMPCSLRQSLGEVERIGCKVKVHDQKGGHFRQTARTGWDRSSREWNSRELNSREHNGRDQTAEERNLREAGGTEPAKEYRWEQTAHQASTLDRWGATEAADTTCMETTLDSEQIQDHGQKRTERVARQGEAWKPVKKRQRMGIEKGTTPAQKGEDEPRQQKGAAIVQQRVGGGEPGVKAGNKVMGKAEEHSSVTSSRHCMQAKLDWIWQRHRNAGQQDRVCHQPEQNRLESGSQELRAIPSRCQSVSPSSQPCHKVSQNLNPHSKAPCGQSHRVFRSPNQNGSHAPQPRRASPCGTASGEPMMKLKGERVSERGNLKNEQCSTAKSEDKEGDDVMDNASRVCDRVAKSAVQEQLHSAQGEYGHDAQYAFHVRSTTLHRRNNATTVSSKDTKILRKGSLVSGRKNEQGKQLRSRECVTRHSSGTGELRSQRRASTVTEDEEQQRMDGQGTPVRGRRSSMVGRRLRHVSQGKKRVLSNRQRNKSMPPEVPAEPGEKALMARCGTQRGESAVSFERADVRKIGDQERPDDAKPTDPEESAVHSRETPVEHVGNGWKEANKVGTELVGEEGSLQGAANLSEDEDALASTFPHTPKAAKRSKRSDASCRMTPRSRKLTEAMRAFRQGKKRRETWREVSLVGAPPSALLGRMCKVYWPLDDAWYAGTIKSYNPQTQKHKVDYNDDENEWLILAEERVQLKLAPGEQWNFNPDQEKEPSSAESEETRPGGEVSGSGSGPKRGGNQGKKKKRGSTVDSASVTLDSSEGAMMPGDVVWGKIKFYPMWPALVLDEQYAERKIGSAPNSREVHTVPVQFFGTFEYARLHHKYVEGFSSGIDRQYHYKSQKTVFLNALEEAERYMNEHKLPPLMDSDCTDSDGQLVEEEEDEGDDGQAANGGRAVDHNVPPKMPLKLGNLTVHSLGTVVTDSEHFHTCYNIVTEGYSASRYFPSMRDPTKLVEYKMEVVRHPTSRKLPLFRVIPADGMTVEGGTPTACWRFISDCVADEKSKLAEEEHPRCFTHSVRSGPVMFGYAVPQVAAFIQALPNARRCNRFSKWVSGCDRGLQMCGEGGMRMGKEANNLSPKVLPDSLQDCPGVMPTGYRPVYVERSGDRCDVCYTDEETLDNQLLQCDKCHVMVHMNCYGELEPPDGDLWLCSLCRPGAPKRPPICCLCPVVGGAMKRTTDGAWAHITCATWIPETCLLDVKRMEPIDGVGRISKDRWKLTCHICKIPYGACIQCNVRTCYLAYHVLCGRNAGLVFEFKEEEYGRSKGDDESMTIKLLSYCKKHGPEQGNAKQGAEQRPLLKATGIQLSQEAYNPPPNPSGCARSEPYNAAVRRGRREPEAVAAALAKRLFVENVPYIINGRRDNLFPVPPVQLANGGVHPVGGKVVQAQASGNLSRLASAGESAGDGRTFGGRGSSASSVNWATVTNGGGELVDSRSEGAGSTVGGIGGATTVGSATKKKDVLSMSERVRYMRSSMHERLTFGKSAIHGWGVFTKKVHRGGDMVIEYGGELVRPVVADMREKRCYDSLVGAGTYMFRVDEERVVDATGAGTIAHLINHACEPNCFSKMVQVNGEDRIIIFAKRDLTAGEELTYDYRFTSKDERLICNCGCAGCRGFVNIDDDDDGSERIVVPRSEICPYHPGRSYDHNQDGDGDHQ